MLNKKIVKSILLVGLVLVCVVGFSPKARAITASELQTQITALLAQLASLQQQLAGIQGNQGVAWCHSFNANLRIGDKGSEIQELVKALGKENILMQGGCSEGGACQSFDEYVASIVSEFQEKYASEILKSYGLKHGTGFVGVSTRAKLNKLYGCNNQPVACTADAKQCPDGSYVSRTGPNCEFAPCPTNACVKEGEKGGTESSSKLTSCCSGLQKTDLTTLWEGVCDNAAGASIVQLFTCINCGNGVCGLGENKCNCPSDCKEQSTSSEKIIVSTPTPGQTIKNPVYVFGKSDTFEANVRIRIKDDNDKVLADTFTMGGSYGVLKSFSKNVVYSAPSIGKGRVEVFEESAKDGTEINKSSILVVFGDYITTTKSITVISPNGGEQWKFGNTYTIHWASDGIIGDVVGYLIFQNDSFACKVFQARADVGQYALTLQEGQSCPTSNVAWQHQVAAGNYKLQIWSTDEKVHDTSDNYFTIASAATTACTDSDGYKNFYAKGSTYGRFMGEIKSWEDYCVGNNDYAYDFTCRTNVYPDSDALDVWADSLACPAGCVDGACQRLSLIQPSAPWSSYSVIKWKADLEAGSKVNLDLINQTCLNNLATGTDKEQCIKAIYHGLNPETGVYSWTNVIMFMSGNFTTNDEYRVRIQEIKSIGAFGAEDQSENTFKVWL